MEWKKWKEAQDLARRIDNEAIFIVAALTEARAGDVRGTLDAQFARALRYRNAQLNRLSVELDDLLIGLAGYKPETNGDEGTPATLSGWAYVSWMGEEEQHCGSPVFNVSRNQAAVDGYHREFSRVNDDEHFGETYTRLVEEGVIFKDDGDWHGVIPATLTMEWPDTEPDE